VVQLIRQAARIAINRQVAGLHFPVDTATGAVLGMTLGAYLVQRMVGANTFDAWSFNGAAYPPASDFDWSDYYDTASNAQTNVGTHVSPIATNPQDLGVSSPLLVWLWTQASAEWI
jgi:hypothetical protein